MGQDPSEEELFVLIHDVSSMQQMEFMFKAVDTAHGGSSIQHVQAH